MKTTNKENKENKENNNIKGLYSNIKHVIIKTNYCRLSVDCESMINFGYSGIAIVTNSVNVAIPLSKIVSSKLEFNNTQLTLVLTSI